MNEVRLIDANALKKAFDKWWGCDDIPATVVEDLIDNAPTVNISQGEWAKGFHEGFKAGSMLADAFNERPQGEKIKKNPYGWVYCSECNSLLEPQDKFCWNCGADMRGEKK